MSTISKKLSRILFNGAALALASAPWKGNVRAIYGFNATGDGYQVFKPANQSNSLAQLVPDGVYIVDVDAATPGFELPGAVLTASTSPAALAPTLTISDVSFVSLPDQPYLELKCRVTSSNSADTMADVFAAYPTRNSPTQGAATFTRVPLGQVVALRFVEIQNDGISSDEAIDLLAVATSGAIGRASYASSAGWSGISEKSNIVLSGPKGTLNYKRLRNSGSRKI